MSEELTELKTKVGIYEKQILTYNGKIDKIDKKTHDTNEKISVLPCGEHKVSIGYLEKAFDSIGTRINVLLFSVLGSIMIIAIVWGYQQIFKTDSLKELIAQEITKLSYAAELYGE